MGSAHASGCMRTFPRYFEDEKFVFPRKDNLTQEDSFVNGFEKACKFL